MLEGQEKEPEVPKHFSYSPPNSHHHMVTRKLKCKSYTPIRSTPSPSEVVKSIGGGSGKRSMTQDDFHTAISVKNLRNKTSSLGLSLGCKKGYPITTKRHLRPKDVTVVMAVRESLKKSVCQGWSSTCKPQQQQQQQQSNKGSASKKTLERTTDNPAVEGPIPFCTRSRRSEENRQLRLNGGVKSKVGNYLSMFIKILFEIVCLGRHIVCRNH